MKLKSIVENLEFLLANAESADNNEISEKIDSQLRQFIDGPSLTKKCLVKRSILLTLCTAILDN